ncbi:MAG: carbohydrate ABC transporter permease [Phycisphaeraceae bacterium]
MNHLAASSNTERVRAVVLYTMLSVFAVITLIPFAYLLFSAFKSQGSFFSFVFWPVNTGADGEPGAWYDVDWGGFTLAHWRTLLFEAGIVRATVNSFFLASVTAILATLFSAMGGYALAKYRFRGRAAVSWLVLGSLVIPYALLIAPGYQLLYWLGLLDTYAGLILPAIAPAFGVYLFRQAFISSLPDALLEAARIDGCSDLRIFFQIALPMVRPMVGAFLLITYLATWNNFIAPQIVIQSAEKLPLSVFVAQLRTPYGTQYGLIMAGTLVAVFPVLVLFLLLQRDFIAGLTAGAVKG